MPVIRKNKILVVITFQAVVIMFCSPWEGELERSGGRTGAGEEDKITQTNEKSN